MLNNAVPKFVKDNILFTREEKNGYTTLMQKQFPGGIKLVNFTAHEIIKLCDGQNNIDQISDALCSQFSDENKAVIKRDILQTIVLLDNEHLIEWKNDFNPFRTTRAKFEILINENMKTYRASEEDFYLIYDFINKYCISENNSKVNNGVIVSKDHLMEKSGLYNEVFLRFRLFNYSERFYFLESAGLIIGILGILDDYPISRRASVTMLAFINQHDILSNINHLFNIFFEDTKTLFNKVKCNLSSNLQDVDMYHKYLSEIGFIREGVLKNEYEQGEDILMYSKLLKIDSVHKKNKGGKQ